MKKIFTLFLLLFLIAFAYMGLNKLPESKTLHVQVSVVNEKTNVFRHVFQDDKVFEFDKNSKKYRLCIGESSPMTDHTVCSIENKTVQVFHFTGETPRKTFTLCLYVNKENTDCRSGSPEGEFFNENEL